MFEQIVERIGQFVQDHRGTTYAMLSVLVLLVAYRLATRGLRKYLKAKAHKPENAQQFLLLWRYVWMAVGLVILVMAFSGSLVSLGLSAAFLGMILGWSLQAPVTGIAAWLMIVLKRPFSIGDRVIIAGITGDVVDINLTHVVLNQVGGTVGGEEKSGRGVMIPNAILFSQIIYNYAMETRFLLDEVPVMVTFESDLPAAQKILREAATRVTSEIIAETRQEPFTREEITDWGIRIRVRYQAIAVERQRISSEIVCLIHAAFRDCATVEFCYPHTEIVHRPKGTESGAPARQ
jgi:small-conductance mechanosensitive channel